MNGDSTRILAHLYRVLSSDSLAAHVDKRLDAAAGSFVTNPAATSDARRLNCELARFIQHLMACGVTPPMRIGTAAAFCDAERLLTVGYVSTAGRGYDAAFADVMAGGAPALNDVLQSIVESMKRRRREEQAKWIVWRTVDMLDWSAQVRLVETLREVNSDILPDNLMRLPASCLVHALRTLIDTTLQARGGPVRFLSERRPFPRNV